MTATASRPDVLPVLRRLFRIRQHSTERALPEVAKAAMAASPRLATAVLVLTLVRGATMPIWLLAMGAVVSSLTQDPDRLPYTLGFLILVTVVQSIMPVITGPLTNELGRRVDLHFRDRTMTCLAEPTGIAHLEEPTSQDLIATAQGIANQDSSPGSGLTGYMNLLSLKVVGLGSVFLLLQYRWWLGLGVLVGSMVIRRRILTIWFKTAEALRGDVAGLRRSEYVRDVVIRPEAAKEHRLFGMGGWLVGRHEQTWSDAMGPVWRRRQRIAREMVAVDLAVVALAAAAAVPIVLGLVAGDLDAARAVVLGGALTAIVAIGGFLPDADFPIRYGFLTLPPVLELEQRVVRQPATATEHRPARNIRDISRSIRFENVTFGYPGTERTVLRDLDLTIEAGSTTALVGANGAGKTTIIKLLGRLYDPTSGAVRVDGTDLRTLDVESWRRCLAVIFQDFARFELPARDNVGFGALDLRDDDRALEQAAEQAGVRDAVRAMPRAWESPLSRHYHDGADLSGGQWQRIALARALLAVQSGARLLVLDEPTASLDVRAEAEFYDRFVDLTAGTTTVLISHRFSTVRRADRICVLDEGQIVEDGTHEHLLAQGGTYARMFNLQASRFTDD